MSFLRPLPAKSFSVSRINRTLGRVYSVALVAVFLEAAVNAFGQIGYLNPLIFYSAIGAIAICVVGVLITQWAFPEIRLWLQIFPAAVLILVVSWPLQLELGAELPEGQQPWIWWLLGVAGIAAGTSYRFSLGVIYLAAAPTIWYFLRTSELGGQVEPLVAIQDSLYAFIFASILVAMVLALRWEAGKADNANQLAIDSAVESARIEAIELERSRIDALVHDSVLTTLLLASTAQTKEQITAASNSASDAIKKLTQLGSEQDEKQPISLTTLFSALARKIQTELKEFEVTQDRLHNLPIPGIVAEAITEAVLQAVDNSIKHAGKNVKRVVRLRGKKSGIKIVVSDDGRGFRPSQISKDRLGIRNSIIDRVERVGGRVFIDSAPGSGANIVIEWDSND